MDPSEEERQRVRSYLQAQGAKLSPAALVERVRAAMAELRAALETVPAARLHDRPTPDEWSAGEAMAHVIAAGRYFGDWIAGCIDGRPDGPAPSTGAEAAPRRTADEWWSELARDREALFARALAADPSSRLERRIPHDRFGPLNWRETLLFLRLHDLDHAGQIKRAGAALRDAPAAAPAPDR